MSLQELKRIRKALEDTVRAYGELQKCGVSREVLVAYLVVKTKMSARRINKMLNAQDDFYNTLLTKEAGELL